MAYVIAAGEIRDSMSTPRGRRLAAEVRAELEAIADALTNAATSIRLSDLPPPKQKPTRRML